jgi:hypothetical protein
MELIQLIYDILLFGWVLLLLVVVISFIHSRKKAKKDNFQQVNFESINRKTVIKQNQNSEVEHQRNGQTTTNLQIFRINQYRQKEVKVVRQPTLNERNTQERTYSEDEQVNKTSGDGKRYTIVNEKIKDSRSNAANYYP